MHKVLVVQNLETKTTPWQKALEEDFTIYHEKNTNAALQIIREQSIDLILLETNLSDIHDIGQKLQKERQDLIPMVPVLEKQEILFAKEISEIMADCLIKPFSLEELRFRIDNQIKMATDNQKIVKNQNFISTIDTHAHDLNNHLTVIRGCFDLISPNLGDGAKKYIEMGSRAVNKIQNILKSITEFDSAS